MEMTNSPATMVSSSFLPAGPLLESLLHISNELVSMKKLPFVQVKNVNTMIRRVKLLSSLFEDISETQSSLPPSCTLCLTELFIIRSVKLLIQGCKDGSSLWGFIQVEYVSNQFYALVKVMARALDILPLSLLNITADIKEKVELLHKQAKKVELYVDSREIQCREDLLQVMKANNHKQNKMNKGFLDFQKLQEILSCIGLREASDYDEEISKLETEAQNQAGTGGLIVVSNIYNLISLVSYSKSMIFRDGRDEERRGEESPTFSIGMNSEFCPSSQSLAQNIPDEFRCPISLDLMGDPVIVSSGHSYDRNSNCTVD